MTNIRRKALIGLGSNRPWHGLPPREIIEKAALSASVLGHHLRLSPLYESPAWPDPAQPAYVNAAASLETCLAPEALLAGLQAIEAGFGRTRSADPSLRYAPRTLDLDLLALGDVVIDAAGLQLPHPRLPERDFVLLPLADVAADWRHPCLHQTAEEMLEGLAEITARRLADGPGAMG